MRRGLRPAVCLKCNLVRMVRQEKSSERGGDPLADVREVVVRLTDTEVGLRRIAVPMGVSAMTVQRIKSPPEDWEPDKKTVYKALTWMERGCPVAEEDTDDTQGDRNGLAKQMEGMARNGDLDGAEAWYIRALDRIDRMVDEPEWLRTLHRDSVSAAYGRVERVLAERARVAAEEASRERAAAMRRAEDNTARRMDLLTPNERDQQTGVTAFAGVVKADAQNGEGETPGAPSKRPVNGPERVPKRDDP